MHPTAIRTNWARRVVSLGLALGLAGGALLLLGRWVGGADGAAAAGSPPPPNAHSAPSAVTYTVTNVLDLPDDNLTDGSCHAAFTAAGHHCTLRAALEQLDHDAGGAVTLPAGTYILSDTAHGDLQLTKDIQLQGASGYNTTIEGDPNGWAHRLLRVTDPAGSVTISGVTLRGGHLTGADGGGLDVEAGHVVLQDSTIITNQADNGGGIYNTGVLVLTRDDILENQATTGSGGGIYNAAATGAASNLTINNSFVNSNLALLHAGGGIYNLGRLVLTGGGMDQNSARNGGGFYVGGAGTLTVTLTEIDFNVATNAFGGGLDSNGATASTELVNTTVGANHAGALGGGIADQQGSVDLSNVTVAHNVLDLLTSDSASDPAGGVGGAGIFASGSQTLTLRNSLVARNTGGSVPDCRGTIDSRNYNLVQNISGCILINQTSHNVTGLDPQLAPLAYNGGGTVDYALLPNSPAVDTANPGGCRDAHGTLLTVDQRAYVRPFDGDANGSARCDIGAFELSWAARLFLPVLER